MQKQAEQKNCPVAKKCGGCQYQGVPYQEQLIKKQKWVAGLLKPYCRTAPITGMEDPFHYRNKVHGVFGRKKDGTVYTGVYAAGTHRIVPVKECLIENEQADAILRTLCKLAQSFRIKIYNEDTGYGLLRHGLIRVGHTTGEIMVVLVCASPVFPSKNNFVKELRRRHPEITTVVLNINDKRTSMVLGERNILLYGKGYIMDELCGLRFRISPNSFYQVNSLQTERLYRKAVELAGLTGKERVIDAYCGIGTIGMIASGKAREVLSVELNRQAVKDAIQNAKHNGIKNVRFQCADAGQYMVQMAENGETADVVFMDPPRSGSDEAFLSSLCKLAPKRVVYISCGPETLARDLKYLTSHGYKAKEAYPFDCFCFTEHAETCVLLTQTRASEV